MQASYMQIAKCKQITCIIEFAGYLRRHSQGASGKHLAAGWVQTAGCERSKRAGLVEAWPR